MEEVTTATSKDWCRCQVMMETIWTGVLPDRGQWSKKEALSGGLPVSASLMLADLAIFCGHRGAVPSNLMDYQVLGPCNGIFEFFALNDRTGLDFGLDSTIGRCFQGCDVQASLAVHVKSDLNRRVFR